MRGVVFIGKGKPLELKELPKPIPADGEVLIKVLTCAVCRTDLHIVDGELDAPKLPLVLGHQIVGRIEQLGKDVIGLKVGDRIGVPWLGGSCGHCGYCKSNKENLCEHPIYTGYQKDGGFAEYTTADHRFVFKLPENYSDTDVAPLLCGGLIGYRAFRFIGQSKKIGFYGFGSAAHILIQVAKRQEIDIYAFTKSHDQTGQQYASELGAVWAGDSTQNPPVSLDAAIIFAPIGDLVPLALSAVKKGGSVICAGIHMSDIPSFPYSLLWEERVLTSVANLTRQDGEEFLTLAKDVPIKTNTHLYPLERVPEALADLRNGAFKGSAVITLA